MPELFNAPDMSIATTAADLLAHWWSRPVAAEVARWASWQPVAATVATVLGSATSIALPSPTTDDERRALLDEYERLFVGPGAVPCPPYESYWRDDVPIDLRRSLMGPCTEDLHRLYGALGLQISAAGELPDHVAVEFEALACALSSPGTLPVAGALLDDHLAKWLPKLCRAVAREAAQPFYRELATVTRAWLPALVGGVPAGETG